MALRSSLLSRPEHFRRFQAKSRPCPRFLQPADLETGASRGSCTFAARIQSLAGLVGAGTGVPSPPVSTGSAGSLPDPASLGATRRPPEAGRLGVDTSASGILLPLIYHFAIVRFTPLGGREMELESDRPFILPAGQFSAMIWMMILLPVDDREADALARTGCGALGWTGERQISWDGSRWFPPAVSLPAFGLDFARDNSNRTAPSWRGCLLLPPQLYLLVGHRFPRLVLEAKAGLSAARDRFPECLLPAYAAGVLLMVA